MRTREYTLEFFGTCVRSIEGRAPRGDGEAATRRRAPNLRDHRLRCCQPERRPGCHRRQLYTRRSCSNTVASQRRVSTPPHNAKGRNELRLSLMMAIAVSMLPTVFQASALPQTLEDEVRAANQAIMAAGLRGDQQAFAALVADELQWIRATGEVLGKAEFTKTINPGIAKSQRTFSEESVAVYGDMAVLVCRSDYIREGQKRAERVLRVFIRRDRHWLLIRHAATPLGQ
jgi:uncharacterized protein (TIGR02246 family)